MSEDSEYIKGYRDGVASQAVEVETAHRDRGEALRTAMRIDSQLTDARDERNRAIMARQAEANGLRGDIEDLTCQLNESREQLALSRSLCESRRLHLDEVEGQLRSASKSQDADCGPDLAIIRERQLIAMYLHQFAGSQVDPVEVAEAVLTGAHMVAT